jgi:hypothetical protein
VWPVAGRFAMTMEGRFAIVCERMDCFTVRRRMSGCMEWSVAGRFAMTI